MGLKYSMEFTVGSFESLYFYRHKCHSLPGICEKVHMKIKFQNSGDEVDHLIAYKIPNLTIFFVLKRSLSICHIILVHF